MRGLRDLRVVDFAFGIAGAHATGPFAPAGADVGRARVIGEHAEGA